LENVAANRFQVKKKEIYVGNDIFDRSRKNINRHNLNTMKNAIKFFLVAILVSIIPIKSNAQVLISLLFGDALNSDKIEFGLVGGFNRSYIVDISESEGLNNFNLGFYFHINMKRSGYISTGVLVKSNVGASGMSTYPVGDEDFDEVFADAELTKKINYFYVPIMWHQRFNQRWYLEGGLQLGLRHKSYDIFTKEDYEGELGYKREVGDDYKRLDAGLIGGVGYKWKKQLKSVSTGINYYYGLVDVSKVDGISIKNSSIYVYVKVPIGAGGKDKKDGVVD
jgi:hypothetical protein